MIVCTGHDVNFQCGVNKCTQHPSRDRYTIQKNEHQYGPLCSDLVILFLQSRYSSHLHIHQMTWYLVIYGDTVVTLPPNIAFQRYILITCRTKLLVPDISSW